MEFLVYILAIFIVFLVTIWALYISNRKNKEFVFDYDFKLPKGDFSGPNPICINFNNLDVVSIERHPSNSEDYTKTLITYLNNKCEHEEMYFFCSIDEHEKLIQEYKNFMEKNNNEIQ